MSSVKLYLHFCDVRETTVSLRRQTPWSIVSHPWSFVFLQVSSIIMKSVFSEACLQVLIETVSPALHAKACLQPQACHLTSWNLLLGTWFLEFGSWNLVLGICLLELGSWCLSLGIWFLEFGSWNLVPGACLLELGSWNLALGTWFLELGSFIIDFYLFLWYNTCDFGY